MANELLPALYQDMAIKRMDHVTVVVDDLPAAKALFVDLGLDVQGEGELEGELVDRVVGLNDVKTAVVMLGAPDGQTTIELTRFYQPTDEQGTQQHLANALGIRHIAFVVEDIDAVVAKLKEKGVEAFSAVQRYEDQYKLCYVRGPEGIILELAEELK